MTALINLCTHSGKILGQKMTRETQRENGRNRHVARTHTHSKRWHSIFPPFLSLLSYILLHFIFLSTTFFCTAHWGCCLSRKEGECITHTRWSNTSPSALLGVVMFPVCLLKLKFHCHISSLNLRVFKRRGIIMSNNLLKALSHIKRTMERSLSCSFSFLPLFFFDYCSSFVTVPAYVPHTAWHAERIWLCLLFFKSRGEAAVTSRQCIVILA